MKNKNLVYIILIVTLSFQFYFSTLLAQQSGDMKLRDRLFFGTYLNLAFGTFTDIELSPFTGYKILPRWWTGIGFNYMLHGYSYAGVSSYSSYYGANAFSQFTLLKDFPANGTSIFAHTEFVELNLRNEIEKRRYFEEFYFIGLGLRQYVGGRTSFALLFLYDVQQKQYTPYNNPVIRIGIVF
jgi:hypothetical protein